MKKNVIRSIAAGAIVSSFFAFFVIVVLMATKAEARYHDGQVGGASFYGYPGEGQACGGKVNLNAMTAAHRTLPCGTKVLVTNLRNGKSVEVRIRDRGPFVRGRIIDLTPAAFSAIENKSRGHTRVRLSVL